MDGVSVVKTRFFFCLVHSSIPAASPWGARFFYTATHATKRNDAHEKEGESGGRDAHTHTPKPPSQDAQMTRGSGWKSVVC
jgi:hypothetical protein